MRDFKGMKRQRGRNRGGGGGGGGKPQQNANRAFDSNGPDGVKVRGNAQHVFEKYQQLARDATSAGDRVLAENYLQHAEHYFRLLRAMQPQRPASEILGRDQFASGFDIDFEDEGAQAQAEAADEAAAENGGDAQDAEARERRDRDGRDRDRNRDDRRDGRDRDGRDRDRGERFEGRRDDRDSRDRDRDRDTRDRGENREARDGEGRDRDRGEGGRRDRWRDRDERRSRDRDDRPRDERPREERSRDERPRDERPRDDRPRGDRDERRDRDDRGEAQRDPLAVVEPQAAAPFAADERPAPVLRDAEGGESHAPAFLQARAEPRPDASGEGETPARKPRRRRAPRSFEAGDGAPTSSESEEA
ncbi:DUF4167 domain-containing protein [Phenylobacterium sp.]|uniref:DUF4167 domain-containing protein n=1 Tax=Phenylobacterium sp. TaxID=1871053 RepID=UPI002F929AFD